MKLTITKTGKLSKCTLAKGETEVILSEGITTISQKAFDSCREKITRLVVSEGVVTIEAGACCSMTALRELVLPETLTTIQARAFEGCTEIKEIHLPDSVKEIGWNAFSDCANLETLRLAEGLEKLPTCIARCDQLRTIKIPDSVKHIGQWAFLASCMEEIVLPESVEWFGDEAFFRCAQLKRISLPSAVEWMGIAMFKECTALEEFNFPTEFRLPANFKDTLRYFENCTALKTVRMTREQAKLFLKATAAQMKKDSMTYNPEKDKYEIFKGCTALTKIEFLADDATRWSDGTCDFRTEADGEHLIKCLKPGILEYTVPDDVTVIEDKAFADNTRLKRLHLGGKLRKLNLTQFGQCKIDSINIPDSLTEIAGNNFFPLTSLDQYNRRVWANIQISAAHPTYGIADEMLFAKKDGKLHTLLYNMQPVRWGALNIPEGVEVLAPSCCNGGKYTEVQLPGSLKVIGARAFASNNNLQKAELPEGVEEIGDEAFIGCRSLMELHLPASLVRFPKKAIVTKKTVIVCAKNSAAEEYAKSNGLDIRCAVAAADGEAAEDDAPLFDWGYGREQQIITEFLGGTEDITLPIKKGGIEVKGYGEKLLDRVRKTVKRVVVPEGIEHIPDKFFARCESLTEVVLPSTLKSIGALALNGCYNLSEIEIPESVTELGTGVYGEGMGQIYLIVYGAWGSAAHKKAQEDGCRFVDIHADENTQQLQRKFLIETNEDGTLRLNTYFFNNSQECIVPEKIGGRAVTEIAHKFLSSFWNFDLLALPKTIRRIEWMDARKVKRFTIDPENPYFKTDDQMWYSGGGTVLEGVLYEAYHHAVELHIPDGVEVISEGAFSGCSALKRLYIPESVRGVLAAYQHIGKQEYHIALDENVSIVGERGSFAEMVARASKKVFLPTDESEEMHALRETFPAYTLQDGTLMLRGYRGDDSEVYIPEEIAGDRVGGMMEWKCGAKLPQVVHIPLSVQQILPVDIAVEAIHVPADHPIYYSEDGKLYSRADKKLISFPQEADHTRFWSEMQEIGETVLDDLCVDVMTIPEGVRKWKSQFCHKGIGKLILPRSLKEAGHMQAKEVVLHTSQMPLLIYCSGCDKVVVLDEREQVCGIFAGVLLKAFQSATWGANYRRYLYQELMTVCPESIESDEEVTLDVMLGWYDAQFDKIKSSDDKLRCAMYRLCAPHGLTEGKREQITAYLRRTVKKAMQFAIDANEMILLKMLLENGIVTSKNSQPLIEMLNEKNMIEWTAVLLEGTRKA